ncbi:putative RNA-directed DNA polymerase from transposon X-element [Araneus ventricosus]|uniref:Putative RNA-directed DNA polymerase from transposon X-element n=1 Tax=Araneus ventricosus TaxID=182803 RepID=A0A4Y2QIR8_ARAVE|nr:putative RNA-directed DNA polymerase from transposon X-element [Araneus ventricosus]
MITHLSESSLINILRLFNRIWREHRFPISWRRALIIPIAKPGKDPQDPTNYRPIALTSCLCKILERMVNARLVYILETNKWLSPFQSGFRRGRSTLDNILRLETSMRDAFVSKKHLISIMFTMEKAYDRTWKCGIMRDLYRIGLRGNLPIFIENFLGTRTFRVRLGNVLSDSFYQNEGVPQGSVLSVILFIIKINDIINTLPPFVHGSLFVDDFQIHCSDEEMGFVEEKLQEVIDRINAWGKINGFVISSQKSVAIHFCKRRGLHPDPKLKLNNQTIPFVSEVKFLSLLLDKKLTFKSHVNHLKRKCTLSMNIVKMLSSSWYGAESSSLLKIYRALIRSKLDYGSAIYGSPSKSTLRPLDTIHNQVLRLSLGAFRTSPILSLYILCNEPSLELRRERLAINLFFKIKSDDSHPSHYNVINPKYGTLFSFRPSFTPTFGFRIGKIFRSINTVDFPVLNKSDEFPPWKDASLNFIDVFEKCHNSTTHNLVYQSIFYDHRQQFSIYEPIFTDGSKADNLVGTTVVIRNSIVSGRLHEFCSVFTSEIYAIYSALVKIADGDYEKIIIYSDSRSAIEALRSVSPLSHPIVLKCVEFYLYLTGKGLNILFCWIPGHSVIIGNEMADKAARRPATVVDNFVPLCD